MLRIVIGKHRELSVVRCGPQEPHGMTTRRSAAAPRKLVGVLRSVTALGKRAVDRMIPATLSALTLAMPSGDFVNRAKRGGHCGSRDDVLLLQLGAKPRDVAAKLADDLSPLAHELLQLHEISDGHGV